MSLTLISWVTHTCVCKTEVKCFFFRSLCRFLGASEKRPDKGIRRWSKKNRSPGVFSSIEGRRLSAAGDESMAAFCRPTIDLLKNGPGVLQHVRRSPPGFASFFFLFISWLETSSTHSPRRPLDGNHLAGGVAEAEDSCKIGPTDGRSPARHNKRADVGGHSAIFCAPIDAGRQTNVSSTCPLTGSDRLPTSAVGTSSRPAVLAQCCDQVDQKKLKKKQVFDNFSRFFFSEGIQSST